MQPADPLVTKLIEGLQADLDETREQRDALIERRMIDIQEIATLQAGLKEAQETLRKLNTDLMLARRMEEDVKKEIIELRSEVARLRIELGKNNSREGQA